MPCPAQPCLPSGAAPRQALPSPASPAMPSPAEPSRAQPSRARPNLARARPAEPRLPNLATPCRAPPSPAQPRSIICAIPPPAPSPPVRFLAPAGYDPVARALALLPCPRPGKPPGGASAVAEVSGVGSVWCGTPTACRLSARRGVPRTSRPARNRPGQALPVVPPGRRLVCAPEPREGSDAAVRESRRLPLAPRTPAKACHCVSGVVCQPGRAVVPVRTCSNRCRSFSSERCLPGNWRQATL